jgi:hypothetical protein
LLFDRDLAETHELPPGCLGVAAAALGDSASREAWLGAHRTRTAPKMAARRANGPFTYTHMHTER